MLKAREGICNQRKGERARGPAELKFLHYIYIYFIFFSGHRVTRSP